MVKVLSLFDGMACGYLAFDSAGLKINQYDAFEIDEYAVKLSSHNYPDIVHHGNVFEGDFSQFEGYDYLIGGSPCTYWSIAQSKDKREREPHGLGWDLFSQYLRALDQERPRYFIYENNASMSPAIKKQITKCFGFAPVLINSALVSAQNRERLYWVGKRNASGGYSPVMIEQPQDRGIILKDILDNADSLPINDTVGGKARAIRASYAKAATLNFIDGEIGQRQTGIATLCINSKVDGKQPSVQHRIYDANGKMPAATASFNPRVIYKVGDRGNGGQSTRLYSIEGKAVTICSGAGGGGAKTGLYCVPGERGNNVFTVTAGTLDYNGRPIPVKLADGDYKIRKLSISECKRLQTVPEWYDMTGIAQSQAYKCLGNGWTVEVIAHLIRATTGTEKKGQTSLDSF